MAKRKVKIQDEEIQEKPVEDDSEFDENASIPRKSSKKLSQDKEDELNEEIDNNFKMATSAAESWVEEAKDDVNFKAGKQWDEGDEAILRQERRPCLTWNKIKPIVKLITGHFIQNNARIQVSPEGAEDQAFSEIADQILNHIDTQAELEFNLGLMFAGTQTTGRTYMELYKDYARDPIFGELKSIYHGRPGVIYPDPRGSSYDLSEDREFVFKMTKKSKTWLKQNYPDKAAIIDEITQDTENPEYTPTMEGDNNNYGADKSRSRTGLNQVEAESFLDVKQKQFHVKEYWRFKYVKKWFVYYPDSGSMPRFDTEEQAQANIDKRRAQFVADGLDPELWAPLKKERTVREVHVAIRCGGQVLADGMSPMEPYYSGFPFFQAIADWTPESDKEELVYQGIVRALKDPQKETNKSRSQLLHIINTSANSGWIKDKGAMDKEDEDNLKNFGSTAGVILTVKKPESRLERIAPVPVPQQQIIREKAASDSFKEVSGVNSDLLAIDQSSNPSGKAIALRIKQAITILEPDFRNFRRTKKLIGIAIMKMVPTLYDTPKLEKILGMSFMQQHQLDKVKLRSFLIQIEDLKYNVMIAEQGDTKTLREETFEDLMNMMQNGMPLPFEVMADFMTIPNKTEVLAKVTAYQQAQQQAAIAQEAMKSNGKNGSKPQVNVPAMAGQ